MWLKKAIVFSLTLLTGSVMAQQVDDYALLPDSNELEIKEKRWSSSFTAGTQFSTFNFGGEKVSAFSTFIAPRLTYNLTDRLMVSGGIMAVNSGINGYQPIAETNTGGNLYTTYLFAQGDYLLNDRVTLFGSAFKQLDGSNPLAPGLYPNESYTVGLDYKVANGMYFGVQVSAGSGGYAPYGFPAGRNSFGGGFGPFR